MYETLGMYVCMLDVRYDRPSEGSSVNHENDYHKILKFINARIYIYRCL